MYKFNIKKGLENKFLFWSIFSKRNARLFFLCRCITYYFKKAEIFFIHFPKIAILFSVWEANNWCNRWNYRKVIDDLGQGYVQKLELTELAKQILKMSDHRLNKEINFQKCIGLFKK